MQDRARISGLIQSSIVSGDDVLAVLEANGYAVVRAGLVPKFDDLDSVVGLLKVLGDINGRIHNNQKCRDAAHQLEWLRDLAVLVLRIDPDETEQTGE